MGKTVKTLLGTAAIFAALAGTFSASAAMADPATTTTGSYTTGYNVTNYANYNMTLDSISPGTAWASRPPKTLDSGSADVEIKLPDSSSSGIHRDNAYATYKATCNYPAMCGTEVKTVKFVFDVTTSIGSSYRVVSDNSLMIVDGKTYDAAPYVTRTTKRGTQTVLQFMNGL